MERWTILDLLDAVMVCDLLEELENRPDERETM